MSATGPVADRPLSGVKVGIAAVRDRPPSRSCRPDPDVHLFPIERPGLTEADDATTRGGPSAKRPDALALAQILLVAIAGTPAGQLDVGSQRW